MTAGLDARELRLRRVILDALSLSSNSVSKYPEG